VRERTYSFEIKGTAPSEIDWRPMMLKSSRHARRIARRHAAKFHNAMVEIIAMWRGMSGRTRVVLNGRCFQNRT